MLTAICLIISTSAADASELDELELTPADIGKAPEVSGPSPNLPMSLKAPRDGKWVNRDGHDLAGVFLPYPLDVDVLRRLRLLSLFPQLCQDEMDKLAEYKDLEKDRALTVQKAQHVVNQVDAELEGGDDTGIPTWLVAVVASGVAGLAGYGLAALRYR